MTHNLLTSCWLQPDNKLLEQTCNKAVEFIKLVASLLQACSNLVNKLGTTSASTSCQQVVATDLLQVCCRFVTSCAFLRVFSQACWQVATSLQQTCYKLDELNSLVTSCGTTCYRAASQQLVNKLWVRNLVQLDKITALLQSCNDKLVTSLFRKQLVDKLCVFACACTFDSLSCMVFLAYIVY